MTIGEHPTPDIFANVYFCWGLVLIAPFLKILQYFLLADVAEASLAWRVCIGYLRSFAGFEVGEEGEGGALELLICDSWHVQLRTKSEVRAFKKKCTFAIISILKKIIMV